jgi:hypothetical protein
MRRGDKKSPTLAASGSGNVDDSRAPSLESSCSSATLESRTSTAPASLPLREDTKRKSESIATSWTKSGRRDRALRF